MAAAGWAKAGRAAIAVLSHAGDRAGAAMLRPAMLRGLLDKARKVAAEHLPEEVVDAGRKLRDEVMERAPTPVAEALEVVAGRSEPAAEDPADAGPPRGNAPADGDVPAETDADVPETSTANAADAAKAATDRDDPEAVLKRVKEKADRGLKPEDRVVVVYFTHEVMEGVEEIREALKGIDTTIREMDLAKEPAQTMRQLANNTGVMVPPWVYINGRYWGGPGEMTSLRGCGDLELVVANRIDELGDEAKRIGKVHETFSEDITVENILERWKQGHILCVDDLDAWFEVAKDGTEHFFYEGGPRPVDEMRAVAEEIVAGVDEERFEAHWQLEPSVQLD